jgi:3-deoxy-D-manno-octulosonate 8-phosphate phosphatase (KDO 8-P phosphatase)
VFKNKWAKIKLIVSDFDGVFTDGGVYMSSVSDEEVKKVSFKDIMGLSLAIKNGYKIGIISGEKNRIIDNIANRFKLEDVFQGIKQKGEVLESLFKKYDLKEEEVIYIGDDINDISALKLSGIPITVPNANFKVKQIKGIKITKSFGGEGAFREIVDKLIYNKKS